jgi:hypothetical protein
MYKFKSSTKFETISMPGSSARLFDVKRAIVKDNKLDRSTGGGMQIEFDISVKNAMTDEEYTDENMLLPRGTRIIVQRLPAARGQGLLSRIARADAGMSSGVTMTYGNSSAADNGFYTIQSARDDDEEFVSTTVNTNSNATTASDPPEPEDSSEKEFAALLAVTDQANAMYRPNTSLSRSSQPNKFTPAGSGAPSQSNAQSFRPQSHSTFQARPNADPELREQERLLAMQAQPTKRRATGIPRTFLNIPPPAQATEDEEGGEGIKLQPNMIGFQALVNRGGGQSGTGAGGKRRDLDYALKLTATEIPEHLQCGICALVVKNAMLVPWDTEGRTACEMCMRDGLAKSGFRCPLTGQDGVSPDDLIANVGLRKATDLFVKGVMEKMDEIVQQQEADEEQEREKQAVEAAKKKINEFEGDGLEKGLVVRKGAGQTKGRRQSDEFGDVFGGDVFDVEEELEDENVEPDEPEVEAVGGVEQVSKKKSIDDNSKNTNADGADKTDVVSEMKNGDKVKTKAETQSNDNSTSKAHKSNAGDGRKGSQSPTLVTRKDNEASTPSRREQLKNRAPPAGYQMGPAGGNGQNQHTQGGQDYGGRGQFNNDYHRGGGRGNFRGGRGRGRFQNYNQGYNAPPPGRGDFQPQVSLYSNTLVSLLPPCISACWFVDSTICNFFIIKATNTISKSITMYHSRLSA